MLNGEVDLRAVARLARLHRSLPLGLDRSFGLTALRGGGGESVGWLLSGGGRVFTTGGRHGGCLSSVRVWDLGFNVGFTP